MIKREIKVIDKYFMEEKLNGDSNGVFMIELERLPEHIKSDIKEYLEENEIKNIPEDGFYRIETLLNYYLEWNGVVGYTEIIVDILKYASICQVKIIKPEIIKG